MIKDSDAIAVLKAQQVKLDDTDYIRKMTWRTHTAHYIELFFGKQSSQYEFISKFSFTNSKKGGTRDVQFADAVIKAKTFIDDCIESINTIGLVKPPRQNFLSKVPNPILAIFIPIILSALGWATIEISNNSSERKIENLNDKIRQLSDSLKINTNLSVKNIIIHDTFYLPSSRISSKKIPVIKSQVNSYNQKGGQTANEINNN